MITPRENWVIMFNQPAKVLKKMKIITIAALLTILIIGIVSASVDSGFGIDVTIVNPDSEDNSDQEQNINENQEVTQNTNQDTYEEEQEEDEERDYEKEDNKIRVIKDPIKKEETKMQEKKLIVLSSKKENIEKESENPIFLLLLNYLLLLAFVPLVILKNKKLKGGLKK